MVGKSRFAVPNWRRSDPNPVRPAYRMPVGRFCRRSWNSGSGMTCWRMFTDDVLVGFEPDQVTVPAHRHRRTNPDSRVSRPRGPRPASMSMPPSGPGGACEQRKPSAVRIAVTSVARPCPANSSAIRAVIRSRATSSISAASSGSSTSAGATLLAGSVAAVFGVLRISAALPGSVPSASRCSNRATALLLLGATSGALPEADRGVVLAAGRPPVARHGPADLCQRLAADPPALPVVLDRDFRDPPQAALMAHPVAEPANVVTRDDDVQIMHPWSCSGVRDQFDDDS